MADDSQNKGTEPKLIEVKRGTQDIHAKHCLWFAWAPGGFTGPEGEVDNAMYRPFSLDVTGMAQVVVRVTDTTKKWRHHPSVDRESGADGIPDDQRGLENDAYQHDDYNSKHLNALTTNLNKLVGVFEIGGAAPTEGNEVDQEIIGEGPTTLAVPTGATQLFIGFHDGREWSNNDYEIPIEYVVSKIVT